MGVYNIEKDIMCITPDGMSCVFEKQEYLELMRQSKIMADQFNQTKLQFGTGDMVQIKDALESLRVMLQVMDCFESTQSHRIVEN